MVKDRQYHLDVLFRNVFCNAWTTVPVIFIQTNIYCVRSNLSRNRRCYKELTVQTTEKLLSDNLCVTEALDTDTMQTAQYTLRRQGWKCGTEQRRKETQRWLWTPWSRLKKKTQHTGIVWHPLLVTKGLVNDFNTSCWQTAYWKINCNPFFS